MKNCDINAFTPFLVGIIVGKGQKRVVNRKLPASRAVNETAMFFMFRTKRFFLKAIESNLYEIISILYLLIYMRFPMPKWMAKIHILN